MRVRSLLLSSALLFACGGATSTSSPETGKTAGASSEECAPSACDGQPTPSHDCVGGAPSPVCTSRGSGTACRKRIDCVKPSAGAPQDHRSVSPCDAAQCGPVPTFDPDECRYGFVNDEPACESIDRSACTWRQHCRPKPCSVEEGTCNVLDRSRLGEPCGLDKSCPEGSTCASVSIDIGDFVPPTCISGNPCTALTCAPGKSCAILESYPAQLVCSN